MSDTDLTGPQFTISAGPWRATVTGLGAGLRELTYDGHPVIVGYAADELAPHSAGQLLAPWPNRVDGGRYRFGDQEHQLALSEPVRQTAIHGLTRWLPWSPLAQTADAVELRCPALGQQGYPFCVQLDARFSVTETGGLAIGITAVNLGRVSAPWGIGSHPYLVLGTGPIDGWELTLPVSSRLPADGRGIPSGPVEDVAGTEYDFRKPRRIGSTSLDHAFTGLTRDEDGNAWVTISEGDRTLALWADQSYSWLQVFTGDGLDAGIRRRALAVEPMSCPPNAFVSGQDLIVLGPGDSITHTWGITFR
jgi:aldose 1-epimerase